MQDKTWQRANERSKKKRGNRFERGWGTYASRVQQVSPSTSPPGALSVLTDSFSLAGMLTERQKGAEAEKKRWQRWEERQKGKKKEKDKLIGQTNRLYILAYILASHAGFYYFIAYSTPWVWLQKVNTFYNWTATLSLLLASAEQLHQTLGQTKLKSTKLLPVGVKMAYEGILPQYTD